MLSSSVSHRGHRGLGEPAEAGAGEKFTTLLEAKMAESVVLEIFSDYV